MYRTWLIWLLLVNLNEGFQFLNQNLRLENRKDLEFSENVLTLDIAYTLCSQDCICEAKQKSVFCYKIDLKTFPHLPVNNEIIVIQNSELLFLKSGMFQDVANVTTLQITSSNVATITRQVFVHFKKLTDVDLSQNNIRILAHDDVINNKGVFFTTSCRNSSISSLDLSRNQIFQITDDSLLNMKYITLLNLSNNAVSEVGSSFKGLMGIRILDLSYNSISRVKDNAFALAFNLEELHLSNNFITCIPAYVFFSCLNLKVLNLKNNLLSSINGKSVSQNTTLTVIDLTENLFTELSRATFPFHLPMLEKLFVSKNQIESLEDNIFSHSNLLTEIHLKDNKIVSITANTFGNLPHLRILNFAGNLLKNLTEEVFGGSKNLEYIFLEDNEIEALGGGIFTHLLKLKIVNLTNNLLTLPEKEWFLQPKFYYLTKQQLLDKTNFVPKSTTFHLSKNHWICDCKIEDFRNWMNSPRNSHNSVKIICESPFYVKGQNVKTVPQYQVSCSWSVAMFSCGRFLLTSLYFYFLLIFLYICVACGCKYQRYQNSYKMH